MLKTSQEIWDLYPDKESFEWLNRGIHCYNTVVNLEEKAGVKPEAKPKQEKSTGLEGKTLSELNKMATGISLKFMSEYPNTWKDKLKQNEEHKLILKQAKKLKDEHKRTNAAK